MLHSSQVILWGGDILPTTNFQTSQMVPLEGNDDKSNDDGLSGGKELVQVLRNWHWVSVSQIDDALLEKRKTRTRMRLEVPTSCPTNSLAIDRRKNT